MPFKQRFQGFERGIMCPIINNGIIFYRHQKLNLSMKSYKRRQFLQSLGMMLPGAALLSTSINCNVFPDDKTTFPPDKKLGVALVGLGGYATDQLAPALENTLRCKLTGIVTGSPDK